MSDNNNLYKAKRSDNGIWVEGLYFEAENEAFIIKKVRMKKYYPDGCLCDFEMQAYKVIPETKCRYVGFNDKVNHKIYEHDILKRDVFGENVVGIITWRDIGSTGFWLKVPENDKTYFYTIGRGQFDDDESNLCNDEVIGNIFDNPEVLAFDLEL